MALAEKANALNPDAATGWYHSTVYTADYLNGDYEHALEVARQNQDAEMFYSYLEIIPIFGQLGLQAGSARRLEKAAKAVSRTRPPRPSRTGGALWNIPDAEIAKLMEGVYKSGVLGAEAKPALTVAYFKLGKLNSAPPRMPVGQRAVTVLRRV